MLFADDMVILGNGVDDLQNSLNQLENYCKRWGLEVNTDKTKVMVFRKRGKIRNDEKWFYCNNVLEVRYFNYWEVFSIILELTIKIMKPLPEKD